MDFKTPFKNAIVVAQDYDSRKYHVKDKPRGAKDFVMSRSELVRFRACPRKWLLGVEDEGNDSTEFGDVFDTIVLSGKHFFDRFAICPETYPDSKTGEQKPWNFNATVCKEFRAKNEAAGKTVIKSDVNGSAHSAAKRLFDDPISMEFLECCAKQVYVTAEYVDKATGIEVPVKALLDLVPNKDHPVYGKCLGDLKTARSAIDRLWQNAVVEHHYHTQAAFFRDLFVAATGEDRNTFVHVIVENSLPYEPCRSFLTSEFMEIGRSTYVGALQEYCRCLKNSNWPGYNHEGNSWPTMPGWKITEPPQWLLSRFADEYMSRYQEPDL